MDDFDRKVLKDFLAENWGEFEMHCSRLEPG
jgi:hypothetical protein